MVTQSTVTPLACVPGAIEAEARPAHFALIAQLFGTELRERRTEADGYRYRFAAERWDDVVRFVANERLCCPFVTFGIELAPEGGPLWLRLSGPEGIHAFLDAELPH